MNYGNVETRKNQGCSQRQRSRPCSGGFWRHWPGDDQRAESLAHVALEFQRRYDLDFIKVPASSAYCVADYGVKHEYRGNVMGDRDYLERVVRNVDDWDRIQPLDITRGNYGQQLTGFADDH